jgi:hypothetical protein
VAIYLGKCITQEQNGKLNILIELFSSLQTAKIQVLKIVEEFIEAEVVQEVVEEVVVEEAGEQETTEAVEDGRVRRMQHQDHIYMMMMMKAWVMKRTI